jgi:type III pantothenate kinase
MSKLLLIDAGNTQIKWATCEDGEAITPVDDKATKEVTESTIAELSGQFPEHGVVLSCVVPKLVHLFKASFKDRLHVVDWNSPLGYVFDYPNPAELGADRLAAVAAVREDGISPAIIVQCGTATAFNVLDEKGRFCGGVIAPGLQVQLAALVGATAQLPSVELTMPDESLGKSTVDAIRSGVMQSFIGGTKEIIRSLCGMDGPALTTVTPPLTTIILTGGNAQFLTESLGMPFTLRPLLVFEGLRIMGDRVFKT